MTTLTDAALSWRAQDPDADRLALVDERGIYIGEEYTQALAGKFILSKKPGVVVTNLSSSRMLDDIAAATNSRVVRTPVGEANVVRAMREHNAVIAGDAAQILFDYLAHGHLVLARLAVE